MRNSRTTRVTPDPPIRAASRTAAVILPTHSSAIATVAARSPQRRRDVLAASIATLRTSKFLATSTRQQQQHHVDSYRDEEEEEERVFQRPVYEYQTRRIFDRQEEDETTAEEEHKTAESEDEVDEDSEQVQEQRTLFTVARQQPQPAAVSSFHNAAASSNSLRHSHSSGHLIQQQQLHQPQQQQTRPQTSHNSRQPLIANRITSQSKSISSPSSTSAVKKKTFTSMRSVASRNAPSSPQSAAAFTISSSSSAIATPAVHSFLRLTPPDSRIRKPQLTQYHDSSLEVICHDRERGEVQFVDHDSSKDEENSRRRKYDPQIANGHAKPESDVYRFEHVFRVRHAAAAANMIPSQEEDIWQRMKPLLTNVYSSAASIPSSTVLLSLGPRTSGKSWSLYCVNGLVQKSVEEIFEKRRLSSDGGNMKIGVSMIVLPSAVTMNTSHMKGAASSSSSSRTCPVIDLLSSEWHGSRGLQPLSTGSLTATPLPQQQWTTIQVPPSADLDEQGNLLGVTMLKNAKSADEMMQAIHKARDRWMFTQQQTNALSSTAASALSGTLILTLHIMHRDATSTALSAPDKKRTIITPTNKKNITASTATSRSQTIRCIEVAGCMKEWTIRKCGMSVKLSSSSSASNQSNEDAQMRELDEIHELLATRADQLGTTTAATTAPKLHHPSSSLLSRFLPSSSTLILLSHLPIRGVNAPGANIVRKWMNLFGAPSPSSNESSSSSSSVVTASFYCHRIPYSSYLLTSLYPTIHSSLLAHSTLYDPLIDLMMEYLGADRNVSKQEKGKKVVEPA